MSFFLGIKMILARVEFFDPIEKTFMFQEWESGIFNYLIFLDLDIVFWGNKTFSSSKLTIPHPRAFVRDFVLVPCAEIAPQYTPVGKTKTLAELVANIDKKNGYLINRIKRN